MERDPQIMPKLDLFPRLAAAGRFVGRLLTPAPHEAPLFMSNHYHPEHFRGAATMLDAALDAPVQQTFGWDSEGRYIDPQEF